MNPVIWEYLIRERILAVARELETAAAELQRLADELRGTAEEL